jgi:hypothetical protein
LIIDHSHFFRLGTSFFDHQTQPNRTGNAEKINIEQGSNENQDQKREINAQFEYPMQKHDKSNREKSGNDVGNKHGTVIKTWLREKRLSAVGAMLRHFQWPFEGKGRGVKHIPFSAIGTLHPQDFAQS